MALAAVIALTLLWGCQAITPEEPEARSYNTPCYQEQGGDVGCAALAVSLQCCPVVRWM